jgi:protein-disulfide isomerase
VSSPARLSVPVRPDDHVRGSATATITVVEYGDYQCPYCGEAFPIVRELERTFADSLRIVFRNLPLGDVHPHAQAAAEMAEAVGLQGKFWEMHDALFQNQRDLSGAALLRYAELVGTDGQRLEQDLASGRPRQRVDADFESAIRSGANGTPTFFVNGARYDGSWKLEPFVAYLRSLLGG